MEKTHFEHKITIKSNNIKDWIERDDMTRVERVCKRAIPCWSILVGEINGAFRKLFFYALNGNSEDGMRA